MDIPENVVKNNIIKIPFSQNNRHKIKNNINKDKYNISIFNPNKSQPPKNTRTA